MTYKGETNNYVNVTLRFREEIGMSTTTFTMAYNMSKVNLVSILQVP